MENIEGFNNTQEPIPEEELSEESFNSREEASDRYIERKSHQVTNPDYFDQFRSDEAAFDEESGLEKTGWRKKSEEPDGLNDYRSNGCRVDGELVLESSEDECEFETKDLHGEDQENNSSSEQEESRQNNEFDYFKDDDIGDDDPWKNI